MKTGAYLINNARGTVVDLDALAGRARDQAISPARRSTCFPASPRPTRTASSSPLQGLDNVILTPHIGGSTEEAQERIGARGRAQVRRLLRHRLDDRRGELPAGGAAAAARRHALHPRAPQRARRARPLNEVFAQPRSTSPRNTIRPMARSATSCSTPTVWCRTRRRCWTRSAASRARCARGSFIAGPELAP